MKKTQGLSNFNKFLILILAVVISAGCIFLVKSKSQNKNPASNIVEANSIETQIKNAVVNKTVFAEYNGKYKFKSVVDISFEEDISIAEQNAIFKNICNAKDKNTFARYMTSQKNLYQDERITLSDGIFKKTVKGKILKKGLYYGNLDKSYVYIENKNGTININNTNHTIDYEISQSGYWLTKSFTPSNSIILMREKYFYDSDNQKFFYITCSYEAV